VSISGRRGSAASLAITFLRNSESSVLASEGSFLVALASACRIFARLTRVAAEVATAKAVGVKEVYMRHGNGKTAA
jgi:hypothetical protein